MNPYDRYPGIDADHNFPQEVREALANSSEFKNMTSGAIEDSLGEYDQVIREDLISYKKIDTDAPSRPAKPILSLSFGAVIVRATGEAYAGGAMEPDLDHYRPQVDNNDGRGFVNEGAAVPAPDGSIELYGKPAGPISVRLVAVDESGNASDPGESETITVVPIETAEAVREDYEEAQAIVDQTLADFAGTVDDAVTKATTAQESADEAAARAAEANNRAMTRLPNGNFEDGLKYWVAQDDIEISSIAQSGTQSALIKGSLPLISESAIPVVEDQIWEIQLHYMPVSNGNLIVAFIDENDVLHGTTSIPVSNSTQWLSSGAIRITVPDGVDTIRPRVAKTGDWFYIDDISVRDVTDVVRLEQAATQARQKAEAAEARAIAVELVQGGIDDRLSENERILTEAGVEGAENLATLDQRLSNAFKAADTVVIQHADDLAKDAVHSTLIEYSVSSSETVAPVSGWSSTTPTRTPGSYIWMRTTVTYGDQSTTVLSPALLTGNDGAQGPQGLKGATGSQGLQGIQGPKGDQGLRGPDGADGTPSYTHIAYADNATGTLNFSTSDPNRDYIGIAVSTTPTDPTVGSAYTWSLIKGADGSQGIQGPTGADGKTSYLHIAYATNSTGTDGFSTTVSAGKTYIGQYTDFVAADSSTPSKYSWTLIKGDIGPQGLQGIQGPKGDQGLRGPDGVDGTPSYTHVAYANNSTGSSGFSTTDPNRTYIGIATSSSPTDPTTPASYNWSLIKGADGSQGIQGPTGANGQTSYLHIAYATSADGSTGFSTTVSSGKTYIGQYTDFTSADSSTPSKYSWTLIKGSTGATGATGAQGPKGDTGPQGLQGIQGPKGDQGVRGPDGADGTPSYTHIAYATSSTGSTGFSTTVSTGKTYIGIATSSSPTDPTTPASYNWSLIKGADGSQGIQGPTGANGQTSYLHIAYATSSTGSTGFSTTDSAGKTYIGQYTDFTSADSSTPSKYSWTLIKGSTGATGATGATGPKGSTGSTGPTGVSVTSVTPYYNRLSSGSSQPAKPTTMTPSGWSATEPAYLSGTKLWRTERIVYSNGTFAYTDVSLDSAYAASDIAVASANSKNSLIRSTSTASGTGTRVGDVWMQFKDTTYTRLIGQWTWSGSSWQKNELSHEVISSVDIGSLTVVGQTTLVDAVAQRIYSDLISANAVFARKMVISEGNLFTDPNFELGMGNWTVVNSGIERTGTSAQGGSYTPGSIRVRAGDKFLLEIDRETLIGTNIPNQVRWICRANYDDGTVGWPVAWIEDEGHNQASVSVTKDGELSVGLFLEAAATSSVKIRLENPRVIRKTGAVLIEDGAVRGTHIIADESMTTKIFGAETGVIEYLTATEKATFLAGLDAIGESWIDGVNIKDKAITAALMNFLTTNGVNRLRLDDNGILLDRISGSRPIFKLDESGLKTYDPRVAGKITWSVDPQTGLVTAIGMTAEDINATGTLSYTKNSAKMGIRDGLYGPGLYAEVGGVDVGSIQTGPGGISMAGPPEPNGYSGGFDIFGTFVEMGSPISDALSNTSGRVRVTSGLAGDGEVEISHRQGDIALISGWNRKVLAGRSRADLAPVVTQEGWITPSRGQYWNVFEGATPRYRREGDVVRLDGHLQLTSTANVIFTLNSGYRPARTKHLPVAAWTNDVPYRLTVNPNGQVTMHGITGVSATAFISLDGITFPLT